MGWVNRRESPMMGWEAVRSGRKERNWKWRDETRHWRGSFRLDRGLLFNTTFHSYLSPLPPRSSILSTFSAAAHPFSRIPLCKATKRRSETAQCVIINANATVKVTRIEASRDWLIIRLCLKEPCLIVYQSLMS